MSILNVTENLTWANDNRTLFYAKQDLKTLRAYQIYRHVLGTDAASDQLVFEEADETYVAYIYKTKSKKFLMIVSASTLSQEYRYREADNPFGEFTIFLPRQREHEYSIDHFGDRFLIRTNDQAKNFRLMATPVDKIGKEHWREIVPNRPDVYLGDFEIFADHLVLEERSRGLTQIRVMPWSGGDRRLRRRAGAGEGHVQRPCLSRRGGARGRELDQLGAGAGAGRLLLHRRRGARGAAPARSASRCRPATSATCSRATSPSAWGCRSSGW